MAIVPGETYVASYYSPNTVYAFEWYYFSAPRTVGPLTALDSAMGDGNGVFCYDNDPCGGLPTYSYNDSNYWVTPVLWSYPFSGFQQPIDTVLMNKGKAGSAIPVKFSLGGDEGMDILREGYPKAKEIQCEAGEATDRIEETVSASASGLKYDPETGQYMYVWKTDKSMANSCFKFDLGLDDYSVHTFTVKFTK